MNLNKKTFGAWAAIAVMATTFVACGNKDNGTGTSAPTTKTVATPATYKIVFVNSDTLLTKYQYFKDLQKKMESKGKKAEGDLASKQQAFQREVQQYQQQQNTLSAEQRAATEQRLQRKGQELQAYQQNAGAALQNEQAKEQAALYDKVAEYLKGYAKTKGYKMVLTYQKGNSAILYGDAELDVTQEVVKGLNEAYEKDKK